MDAYQPESRWSWSHVEQGLAAALGVMQKLVGQAGAGTALLTLFLIDDNILSCWLDWKGVAFILA